MRVARAQEVGVQRVHLPARVVDRAGGGDQRLAGDLAAEHPLAVLVGRAAAEEVDLDGFEIEQLDEVVEGGHRFILVDRNRWHRIGSSLGSRGARWKSWPPGTEVSTCRSTRSTRSGRRSVGPPPEFEQPVEPRQIRTPGAGLPAACARRRADSGCCPHAVG